MNGLLWLLGFGILFFLMMCYGCGAHIADGFQAADDGDATRGIRSATDDARDPVCGADVAAGHGYAKACGGRTYRFCSRACLDRFDAEPERFTIG